MKPERKKLLTVALIGFAIALVVVFTQGILHVSGAADRLRIACDGCFVAGALLLGVGGLVWGHAGGVTDGLGFSVKTLLSLKWSAFGDYKEGFAEYRKRREAKNGDPKPYLLVGGAYFAVSLLLLLAYGAAKPRL